MSWIDMILWIALGLALIAFGKWHGRRERHSREGGEGGTPLDAGNAHGAPSTESGTSSKWWWGGRSDGDGGGGDSDGGGGGD